MAKDNQPVKPDKPDKPDKPLKRVKPTKNAAKIFLRKKRSVTQVNEKMDRNGKLNDGIRDVHGITIEEWRAAGGTVE